MEEDVIPNTDHKNLFSLTKFCITGSLNPGMPYIVLRELALECGVIVSINRIKDEPLYYAKLYAKLAKFKPVLISDLSFVDSTHKDISIHFVNPLEDWDIQVLKNAISFLYSFYNVYQGITDEHKKSLSYPTGLQTSDEPYSLNACILYGMCRYYQITLPLDISYEDLKNKVLCNTNLMLTSLDYYDEMDKEEQKKEKDYEAEEEKSEDEEDEKERFHHYEELKIVGDLFQDVGYLQNNFYPITQTQSIVCGALVYFTDLTFYKNPLEEFKQIRLGKRAKDKKWREYQKKNPNLLDLNLYFNPYLPQTCYLEETIKHHLNLFDYPTYDFIGTTEFETLQELFIRENFHIGWVPNIDKKETPIFLETLNDLDPFEIIVYGSLYEKLSFTSWKELNELFLKSRLFLNPFENKPTTFDENKIKRLIKLGNFILNPSYDYQYLFDSVNKKVKEEIQTCLETIDEIFFEKQIEVNGFKEYKMTYLNSPQELKLIFEETLNHLFNVCMFMRGWSGNSVDPFPIEQVPFGNQDKTDKNTIESIFELDAWNQKTLGVFYDFPLILWKSEFTKSNIEDQGLTIGQRIEMIKNGENSSISSCIRLSSNVLGSTYCFYCKLFELQPKFKIENLRFIS